MNLNKTITGPDIATSVPETIANLSHFNLNETLKTTFKADYLIPVYHREMLPNDRFDVSINNMSRILSMIAPNMDAIELKLFAFFVPNRLLWRRWLNFMGERTFQADDVDYTIPQVNMNDDSNKSLGIADYLGIKPTGTTVDYTVNALPFRAYNKIYNEWFRRNLLQPEVTEYDDEALIPLSEYKLMKIGKADDYFTECLPTPASQDVEIGLVGNASVYARKDLETTLIGSTNSPDQKVIYNMNAQSSSSNAGFMANIKPVEGISAVDTHLYADMSLVSGVSIEALRHASALQVLLEKDSRAGNLYIDLMRAHFGVDVPDFLIGRSQFLGSCTFDIGTQAVVNSADTADTPLGTMAGIGYGEGSQHLCEVSAIEHGQFMIMAVVKSKPTYQYGLDRKWSRKERYDFPFPEFFNLGEQPVLEKEIFFNAENVNTKKVFGYTPRYQEERRGYDKISGLMRSDVPGSLDVWHLAQKWSSAPGLNEEFILSATPLERCVSVPTEDYVLFHALFVINADRCLPIYQKPSILAGTASL
nr:MAG: major capsid protein [Microvirus Sku118]